MIDRIKSDSGLMGPSHALSAIAMLFLLTWLASDFVFQDLLGTNSAIVFIAATIIVVGSALMPDLDATRSTSISVLGVVGSVLSTVMRAFSKTIQSVIRSKTDAADPDPHRGFWHTIIAAFIAGGLVFGLTSINSTLFTIGEKEIKFSFFIVVFILFMSIKLLIAALIKSLYKKQKGSVLTAALIDAAILAISLMLIVSTPPGVDFRWVSAAVTLGWICHLIGDMMTVNGVPILFPLKFKGKRWWNFRFPLGIKAGGVVEMSILNPLFLIIAVVAGINVIPLLT